MKASCKLKETKYYLRNSRRVPNRGLLQDTCPAQVWSFPFLCQCLFLLLDTGTGSMDMGMDMGMGLRVGNSKKEDDEVMALKFKVNNYAMHLWIKICESFQIHTGNVSGMIRTAYRTKRNVNQFKWNPIRNNSTTAFLNLTAISTWTSSASAAISIGTAISTWTTSCKVFIKCNQLYVNCLDACIEQIEIVFTREICMQFHLIWPKICYFNWFSPK